MQNTIKIKKGLDIPVSGVAQETISDVRSITEYAVKPTDYVGVTPRLKVAEGDKVKAGTTLFVDKNNEWAHFVSPVSGTVKAVVRGAKRALQAVVITTDNAKDYEVNPTGDPTKLSRQEVKDLMVNGGCWTMLRRRPFGIAPLPTDEPKAIFVSCFNSAPLAPNYDFVMEGRTDDFLMGLKVLAKLTDGKVHLGFRQGQKLAQVAEKAPVEIHYFQGPHPAGNVGTQIAAIDPIDRGEQVWAVDVQDVAIIGHLFLTGQYEPERVMAFAGPSAQNPRYYRMIAGANIETLCKEQFSGEAHARIISGDVLSGQKLDLYETSLSKDCYAGAHDSLISALPEGDYYEFMGWLMPGLKKFSLSRTFLSGFFAKCCCASKCKNGSKYNFDTNLHGEWRPMVVTGSYEQVFPFKIYPMQLIKAAIIGDIDLMESLGIYEVEPEDFALCEYVDTSKTEIQTIIREALEKIRKEAM